MNKAKIAFLIASLASFSLFATATDAEIAAAKAKGQVWCNTSTKACHPSDDKYFGKTKAGKFVDAAALPAGYHMAGAAAPKKAKKTTAKM